MSSSRLSADTFTERQWSAAPLLAGFSVEDVWQLPVRGRAGDLAALADALALDRPRKQPHRDKAAGDSRVYDALFAIRWWLGRWLGWDDDSAPRPGLRAALPQEFRHLRRGPDFASVPLRSVLLTDQEWVAEIVNATGHGVMHVGWVPAPSPPSGSDDAEFTAEMTVLFRPQGRLGRAYMAAIKPLRVWLVYPALLRKFGDDWDAREPRHQGRAGDAQGSRGDDGGHTAYVQ